MMNVNNKNEEAGLLEDQNSSSSSASASSPPAEDADVAPAEPPARRQFPNVMIPARDPNAVLSGGGISFLSGNGNAKFSYGYSSFKGKRASMEDFYETRISEVDGQMVAFFGVFDVEAFRQTDANYLTEEKGQHKDAGSTASTAVLLGDRLLVANVGDSRVVACRAGSSRPPSFPLTLCKISIFGGIFYLTCIK